MTRRCFNILSQKLLTKFHVIEKPNLSLKSLALALARRSRVAFDVLLR